MIIAHRGNCWGPDPERENKPSYLQKTINNDYYVEADVWALGKNLYFGHDKPLYLAENKFLKDNQHYLICHAKNVLALRILLDLDMHCFMHNNDIAVLTSKNYIWTYPGGPLGEKSIAVMPEDNAFDNIDKGLQTYYFYQLNCAGVCTDYAVVIKYSK